MLRFVLCVLVMLTGCEAYAEGMRTYSFTPVITAAAYAQNDQIGVLQKLSGILTYPRGSINLLNWVILDKEKAKHDLELLFFSKGVTVASADNAAVSITDAEMASGFLGRISVAAGDYVDSAASSDATKTMDMIWSGEDSYEPSLWILIVCVDAGGCDYAAVNDLVFKFAFFE